MAPTSPSISTNAASVRQALDNACADLVVNAAAMTAIDECERDPGLAYAVNARAVAVMSAHCRSSGAAFVHVSTDHFFSGDRDRRHDEHAPVRLVNEYARTKFAGEAFARTYPDALVLRTNVTGLRDWMGRPTFAEWVFDALRRRAPLVPVRRFLHLDHRCAELRPRAVRSRGMGAVGASSTTLRERSKASAR